MPRATKLLAVTTVAAIVAAVWLYLDNRSLRAALDARDAYEDVATAVTPKVAARTADPWTEATRAPGTGAGGHHSNGPAPALPDQKEESRLDKRVRRNQEPSALLGRHDGETEAEYRARVMPMITAGLAIPRARAEEMRKQAEEKAHVTPEQSKQLDRAFDKVYDGVLDYTNKAIADGQLSPYDRNISGVLQYAGGLGTMLEEANGQIGQVLSADQLKALSENGFEWGEYLGVEAPWEKLTPPPPPKK